ncbi:MAG: shikimate kinase [Planctomycetota bacterium]|nr:shikimate kinase [Planctomycetota bacterium]
MHLVLIGYRCAGKTTVGRMVADRLGMRFFDTDKLVEAKAKMPIPRIFEEGGEGEFRRLESEVIEEISGGDGKVIAVGGGGVCRGKNVSSLKKKGRLFFLQITPEEVKKRMESDPAASASRPPLTRDDVLEEARELMTRRERFYKEAADFTIPAVDRPPEEIVEEIIKLRDVQPPKKENGAGRRRLTRDRSSDRTKKKRPLRRGDSTGDNFPREG